MNWQTKLFLLFWTAIVIILIGLMTMLYVSLLPHFLLIGDIAFIVLCIFLCYGVILGGYGTFHVMCLWSLNRKVIVRGEVVAYLDRETDTFTHLSAEHERAKVQQMLPPPKEEREPETPDEDIREMYKKGMHLRDIAALTNSSYYRVQKVCATK